MYDIAMEAAWATAFATARNFANVFISEFVPAGLHAAEKNYLFIMGDYLQFIGTELLLNTWSSDVLTHCKRLFDHHGIPDELTAENKP